MGESVKTSELSVLLVFLLFVSMPFAYASPILHITVGTDKPSYFQQETVRVCGSVALGEHPLRGSLMALEVRNESGHIVAAGTNQTNEKDLFTFVFKSSPNVSSQNYTAFVSALWENQTAVSCSTFLIEASGSTGYHENSGNQEVPISVVISILLVVFGFLLLSVLIISIFLFLKSKKIEVKIEPPAPPEKQIDEKHEACINCGKYFLRIRTFCPYCFAYHGRDGMKKA